MHKVREHTICRGRFVKSAFNQYLHSTFRVQTGQVDSAEMLFCRQLAADGQQAPSGVICRVSVPTEDLASV
jgi:hypothetical protein